MAYSRFVLLWSLVWVLGACGRLGVDLLPVPGTVERPAPPDPDAGSVPDSGLISEAGTDAAIDSGTPPQLDASSEGAVDSSVDSGNGDSGMDANVQPACATPCANSHGTADCTTGQCQISCSIGYTDCDGNPANGCEIATSSDLMSCGGCDLECTTSFGTTQCAQGICAPSCASGMAGDCDSDATNGCEANLMTDLQSCGSCGVTCTNAHGSTSCSAGVCTPGCAADYADCDGDLTNGCETQIGTDPSNCGGCGLTCNTAFQVCVNQQCQVSTCPSGLGDCDANQADCETNLTSSVGDCGFCNNTCTTAHGTPRCTSGTCGIASCSSGYANCDANVANGCEVTLATNVSNCGSCGTACTNGHGSTSCSGASCVPTCSSGWGTCDGNPRNGCETALDTVTNCGSCGNACPNAMMGATAACNSGVCGYTCSAMSGVYALRINGTTSWPSRQYIDSGSGPISWWLRVTITQSGMSLSGTAQLCDQSAPDFHNSLTSDRYLIDYPSAAFTPGAPGATISATLASLSPGAGLTVARTAHVLGVSMADPLNGTWPSLSSVRSSQVDHDGEGEVGVTEIYVKDSTYDHAPTAGTLSAARASHKYGAQRLRFSLGGALTACNGASGSATVQSYDTKIIGCRLESGSDCNSSQYTHLDSNSVLHTVSNSSYTLKWLGAPGASFTCAQVRAAL